MKFKYKVIPLQHGVYRIYWKVGGNSVASIGSDDYGNQWFAPSNWTFNPKRIYDGRVIGPIGTKWHNVLKVDLIETQ